MMHIDLTTVGNLAAHTYVADAIRRHGAVPSAELSHSGQYAAEIKKHVKKPVACIGGLSDPAQMEGIIASGQADVVYMGRQLLADPFLTNKVAAGKEVHLVEMRDTLAPDCNIRHRPILMRKVNQYTTIHTGWAGLSISSDGLLCRNADGKEELIPADTIICAVGQRANRPANITKAIYEGFHAAMDI